MRGCSMKSKISLIHGDCLEELPKLEDGSIDLTVTSPPYDNLRTYNGSLDWGEHIWKPVIQELFRITKDGGVVVWVVGDATIKGSETGTSFRQALWAMECGFKLHDTMIYAKNSYMPHGGNRYEQQYEYMFVFVKGALKTFNKITIPCKTAGTKRNRSNEKECGMKRRNISTIVNATKPLPNIWWYDVGHNDKTIHSAVFPEKLAHDHIISWSNEGDTVLDCFMGSGTTGKMAKKLNRNFIGIEKELKYFKIAKKRIFNEI